MKNFKKVSAVAMAMALTVASAVPAFAVEKATYTGTLSSEDLTINMDLPADGTLTVKPFAGTQISTAPLYFTNNSENTNGVEDVIYSVNLAGYTCVATPKDTTDRNAAIKVATTIPADTTKTFTATIELGNEVSSDAVTSDAVAFKTSFASAAALNIERLSTASYDGKTVTDYTKSATDSAVDVRPGYSIPFRITGKMNTKATWAAGDKIVVVPVFSVDVSVTGSAVQ